VAVVGATSLRQGTGPWLAKHFQDAGAEIVAVMGRTSESALDASKDLQNRFQISSQAFSDWNQMIDVSTPDLVVITTPPDAHRKFLFQALERGMPVLAEKPFIWDVDRNNVEDVTELRTAFLNRNIPIFINTQWLESLKEFKKIYPNCNVNYLENFEMSLSPASKGVQRVVDSLPHAWNMLCHLAGKGELQSIEADQSQDSELRISGVYQHHYGSCAFSFLMETCEGQPRPFSYAINGCKVERQLDMTDYSMGFRHENGVFLIRDPMKSKVHSVLNFFQGKSYSDDLKNIVLETQLLTRSVETLL
jgi:hypothetical protein